jgi:16S rRNA (uracil1498-N3)-methyltransferase
MPEIFTLESIESFLTHITVSDFSLAAIDSDRDNLLDILQQKISVGSTPNILLFVGPEGGFSAEEVELLNGNGFTGVSLGSSRLRTETAAISGISIIQMYINQQKERALDT